MPGPDAIRLKHMLDAAEEALAFAAGHSRADLDADRKLVLALIKLVEIIGEAAAKVSGETRQRHAAIPWDAVVATRNRLIHGYFDINLDIVWDTVTVDLPPLLAELRKVA
ncbi:MAG: hypothetical protein EFKGCFLK_01112 [Rhodocyclaceae bacterium]|nr:MAG: DUF86 domain-containing protein [Rhodocyclaceae bacterium]MBE7423928.1 DUF86 domain-containing protein [Zoogloeaceae bacterium]MBV6407545.1 hypothetical protein [Rhodocyclaceae bacterium]MCK6384890.1 DUF86 domain-containing protein [Rhodocyclaceae bacterium]CAG0934109.1 hypothetical protein RHDC3_02813 [Rhodocyclaceae bacterium]